MSRAAAGVVRLIDYEYGGFNWRGFDLATHLSHWAGGAEDGRYDDEALPYTRCPSSGVACRDCGRATYIGERS